MTSVPGPTPPHLKRCDRHGVLFNEERYNSCAVCRASVDAPKMTAGSVLLGLVGLGLIGCGVMMAGGPTVMAIAEVGDRAVAATARSIRLDPEPVREEIETLETLIYASDEGPQQSGPAIRAAASSLARAVANLDGAPQQLLDRFSREIVAFGARCDPRPAVDPSSHGMTNATDWEKVRARVFAGARWYRNSSSGRHLATFGTPPTGSN